MTANRAALDSATLFIAVLALMTGARIAALIYSPLGLYHDEAQYWAWSRTFDWGYFTKPPMIAGDRRDHNTSSARTLNAAGRLLAHAIAAAAIYGSDGARLALGLGFGRRLAAAAGRVTIVEPDLHRMRSCYRSGWLSLYASVAAARDAELGLGHRVGFFFGRRRWRMLTSFYVWPSLRGSCRRCGSAGERTRGWQAQSASSLSHRTSGGTCSMASPQRVIQHRKRAWT